MKTCPVCALDLEDSYFFCPEDGSSLAFLPAESNTASNTVNPSRTDSDSPSRSASVSSSRTDDEPAGGVVLYCPMCAAEYPLTFSSCPVHGVQLTKHSIPSSSGVKTVANEPVKSMHETAADFQPSVKTVAHEPGKTTHETGADFQSSGKTAAHEPVKSNHETAAYVQPIVKTVAHEPDNTGQETAAVLQWRSKNAAHEPVNTTYEKAPNSQSRRATVAQPGKATYETASDLKSIEKNVAHDLGYTTHETAAVLQWRGKNVAHEPGNTARETAPDLQSQRVQSRSTKHLATTIDPKRPLIDSPRHSTVSQPDNPENETTRSVITSELTAADVFDDGTIASDYQDSIGGPHEHRLERPGFRVAAMATVIVLSVLALIALYSVISNLSSRSSTAAKTANTNKSATQPLPFVPTPQEARDYKEEPPQQSDSATVASAPEAPVERVRRDSAPSLTSVQPVRKTTDSAPVPRAHEAEAPPVTTTRASESTMRALPRGNALPREIALPRGNTGGFDARLVRVRGRKTPDGFRYDLTFNMQEEAGRAANWQRVLISTRSISGASHSQAIPFSHRLGAAGALTFTISVELAGQSEADWKGRVVCTTLGWDNKGAPLQASFGANVSP